MAPTRKAFPKGKSSSNPRQFSGAKYKYLFQREYPPIKRTIFPTKTQHFESMIFHWIPQRRGGGYRGRCQVNGLLISSGYREDHPPENAVSSEVWTSGSSEMDGWMDGSGRNFFATRASRLNFTSKCRELLIPLILQKSSLVKYDNLPRWIGRVFFLHPWKLTAGTFKKSPKWQGKWSSVHLNFWVQNVNFHGVYN